ncbi:RNA polymerase sigma factor [Flavobacterium stagni]|uniref:RNA polymerase sigma factor n=1 Tax=Flavobacterium stagni TaxID=2506421 RepID=A0A4Q1K938_9FLAO|nr:RNA polymerase sigma factor [Flavobacterium stagni]RXR22570.1 RNA polymerase sigma factor [Flavobacterium stagni]
MSSEDTICQDSIYESFYRKHVKALRNYLYYKFGDLDQAEDCTQEAFIKLWQNCDQVPVEKAKSFLYTVANNLSLNQVAHKKVVLEFGKKNTQRTETNESPDYILEEEEFKTKLLSAIANLNETQRTAFLMHRIDGKKYHEIAEELNISVKAVEKRIHLALLELRKKFSNF